MVSSGLNLTATVTAPQWQDPWYVLASGGPPVGSGPLYSAAFQSPGVAAPSKLIASDCWRWARETRHVQLLLHRPDVERPLNGTNLSREVRQFAWSPKTLEDVR